MQEHPSVNQAKNNYFSLFIELNLGSREYTEEKSFH